jgi:D-alanyl-D-alanine carboxypeptidase/D-alanyl-D-alanine-endopeptidase (penicillin-binding protein 4)
MAVAQAPASDDLASRIESVIGAPQYKQARWGILVVDAQDGHTIYTRNPDQLFLPASTTKLYSCAAALAALEPDYRFETPVYRRGEVKDGRLSGDLILVAQGDLTFGGRTDPSGRLAFRDHDHIYANGGSNGQLTDTDPLAGLRDLALRVAAAGIHQVDGDVLIDDRLFEKSRGSGSGPDLLSPIVVNDNLVDLIITPATEPGKSATVQMRPKTAFFDLKAAVTSVPATRPIAIRIHAGSHRIEVSGEMPTKRKPLLRVHEVPDPAAFARALFIEALRQAGVSVSADLRKPSQAGLPGRGNYARLERVAVFKSPPLSELIKVTLKVSHNLYASTLPLLIAVHDGKRTLADGLHWERQFLAGLGVDVDTISFAGGAGGNNADAVTPRASVELLRALARRPDYRFLEAGLPVLGVDGTLVDAVTPSSPARGQVKAKTGTLDWYDVMNDRLLLTSKALAGTMKTANGRTLVLALYVNNVPLPKGVGATREGKTLGKLCEILYEHTP